MGKWGELAERLEARDNSDISDNSPPNVTNVTNVTDLPPPLIGGLKQLRSMAAPRLVSPDNWPGVVSEALALAKDGWASKALALGWNTHDLFGAVTDRDGYADADGLAVWLGGRRVLAICETYASVGDDNGRAYFNRSTRLGETLLWEIGR